MSINIKKILLIVVILGVFVIAMFIPFKQALVFYKGQTEELAAYLPLQTGDTFQLIWKHSIHLTDVVEKYEVEKNQNIKQYEIVYEHFGIGMPSNASEGETFTYEDGKYHVKNLENVFPDIKLRNGKTVSENRFVWGEDGQHLVSLNHYFKPGQRLKIEVNRLTLWDCLRGVQIHE